MRTITKDQLNYMQTLLNSIQFEISKGIQSETVSTSYLLEKTTKLLKEVKKLDNSI